MGCTVYALRGEPWRLYAGIYFVGGALSYVSQFVFSGLFKFYQYRSHWIADPFVDERAARRPLALSLRSALGADRLPRIDSRIVAVSYSALLWAPSVAFVALRRWRWPLVAIVKGAPTEPWAAPFVCGRPPPPTYSPGSL